ncbi:bifunctional DNA primase/polymerase [Ruegeria lacuscaerulensis]|uniref:bifunctional DNA primase/polymerase n=1 Tax=Ruegeria lacuscaerulensis TaxID=55218 RepID=UPI001479D4E3|nr:bifunctional DNA primase/polymerase [Ruegeria lacuscaerulensis]
MNTIAEIASPLQDMGWPPVPTAGKGGAMRGWNTANTRFWSEIELLRMERDFSDHNVGIALQPTNLAIDVDITDRHAANQVRQILETHIGVTPIIRYGSAPKFVALYRSAGGIRSQKKNPVEIFSGTGLIVGFGIHPKTQRPYHYEGPTPLDIPADSADLPLVTADALDRALVDMMPIIQAHRAARTANVRLTASTWFDRWHDLKHLGWFLATKTIAKEANCADAQGRHDAFWTLMNIATRCDREPDELMHVLSVFAPDLLDYLSPADDPDYIERTTEYVLNQGSR